MSGLRDWVIDSPFKAAEAARGRKGQDGVVTFSPACTRESVFVLRIVEKCVVGGGRPVFHDFLVYVILLVSPWRVVAVEVANGDYGFTNRVEGLRPGKWCFRGLVNRRDG